MDYPHCASMATKEQTKRTSLGYRTFRCSGCKRIFNERTGTPFNFLEYPTDLVLLVVLWRLRYKLSLLDLAEDSGTTEQDMVDSEEQSMLKKRSFQW